jgi:hypothetical protein
MRTLLVTIAALSLSASAVACSPYSLEPRTPPVAAFGATKPDVATICVVRPAHTALAVTFAVHDNEQIVGATRGESYFCYEAEPGDHAIVSDTGDSVDSEGRARIRVVAGQRYYLHQDFDNVLGSITSKLQWVEEARARELMADCDYKVIVGVPGSERLPGPLPRARARAIASAQPSE